MAKKKTKQKERQPTNTFRATNEVEQMDFERISSMEGYGSIASWAHSLAKRRAELMLEAHKSGRYVLVRGIVTPHIDVSGADPFDCQLENAQRILTDPQSTDSRRNDAADWLAMVRTKGTSTQQARAIELTSWLTSRELLRHEAWLSTFTQFSVEERAAQRRTHSDAPSD